MRIKAEGPRKNRIQAVVVTENLENLEDKLKKNKDRTYNNWSLHFQQDQRITQIERRLSIEAYKAYDEYKVGMKNIEGI